MSKRNIIIASIILVLVILIVAQSKKEDHDVKKAIEAENTKLFPDFKPEAVASIFIKDYEKNTAVTLIKDKDIWKIKEKSDFPADKAAIDKMLASLPKIRLGSKVADSDDANAKKFGLDKGLEVRVSERAFKFGMASGSRIALEYDKGIYLSPSNEKPSFTKYDGEWRERKLFPTKNPEDAVAMTLALDGEKEIKITLDEKGEAKTDGVEKADAAKAKNILSSAATLRISNFIDNEPETETEADKKPIIKGWFEVTFKNGEKTKIELSGKKIKGKPDLIVIKDGKQFGLADYYYNRIAKPDLTAKEEPKK